MKIIPERLRARAADRRLRRALRLLGKAEAQQILAASLAEERRPGDRGHAGRTKQMPGFLGGGFSLQTAHVGHDVIRPRGHGWLHACILERAQQPSALGLMIGCQPRVEGRRQLLQTRSGTDLKR